MNNPIKVLFNKMLSNSRGGKEDYKGYRCLTQHGVNVDIYHFYTILRNEHIGTISVINLNQATLDLTHYATEIEKERLKECCGLI